MNSSKLALAVSIALLLAVPFIRYRVKLWGWYEIHPPVNGLWLVHPELSPPGYSVTLQERAPHREGN